MLVRVSPWLLSKELGKSPRWLVYSVAGGSPRGVGRSSEEAPCLIVFREKGGGIKSGYGPLDAQAGQAVE